MDMSTENSTVFKSNVSNSRLVINESIVPPVLLFVIGVAGNITALVILIRSCTEHRWRPFYRFVGGLIASDLSGIVLTYPIIISTYVSNFTFVFSTVLCGFISFMLTFSLIANALIICAMSLDRFLASIFPLTYRKLSNGFRINLTLLGIWMLSTIICGVPLIGFGSFRIFYPGSWCCFNFTSDDARDKAFTYFFSVILLLIIVSTITLNAIVISSLCWKFYKRERRNTKAKRNDVSIIIYIVTVVVFFVVFTSPIMIRMLMHAIMDDLDDEKVDLLTGRLSLANALIDPGIYLLFKRVTFSSIGRLSIFLVQRFRMRQVEGEENPPRLQAEQMSVTETKIRMSENFTASVNM